MLKNCPHLRMAMQGGHPRPNSELIVERRQQLSPATIDKILRRSRHPQPLSCNPCPTSGEDQKSPLMKAHNHAHLSATPDSTRDFSPEFPDKIPTFPLPPTSSPRVVQQQRTIRQPRSPNKVKKEAHRRGGGATNKQNNKDPDHDQDTDAPQRSMNGNPHAPLYCAFIETDRAHDFHYSDRFVSWLEDAHDVAHMHQNRFSVQSQTSAATAVSPAVEQTRAALEDVKIEGRDAKKRKRNSSYFERDCWKLAEKPWRHQAENNKAQRVETNRRGADESMLRSDEPISKRSRIMQSIKRTLHRSSWPLAGSKSSSIAKNDKQVKRASAPPGIPKRHLAAGADEAGDDEKSAGQVLRSDARTVISRMSMRAPSMGWRGRKPNTRQIRRLKIAVVGDVGSGKSALLNRLLIDDYHETAPSTSANCRTVMVALDNGSVYAVELWDMPGSEASLQSHNPLDGNFFHAAIICYSVEKASNLQSVVHRWPQRLLSSLVECPLFVVATKRDLRPTYPAIQLSFLQEPQAETQMGISSATRIHALQFYESSALADSADDVHDMLRDLVARVADVEEKTAQRMREMTKMQYSPRDAVVGIARGTGKTVSGLVRRQVRQGVKSVTSQPLGASGGLL